ncbi:MAG TPA: hypothetical protein VF665_12115 [Longimicrobium sp.]|jgi:hypothetical protein|uniref:hypothetical protein n=1 Tax=Longimicrobium sp. TaxID=2029185 RepID=UPI002EDBA356
MMTPILRTALLAAALACPSLLRAQSCTLAPADRAWIQSALDGWQHASGESLRQGARPLPWIVLFDTACAWHLNPAADAGLAATSETFRFDGNDVPVRSLVHQGKVWIPNGDTVPAQGLAFAAPRGDRGETFFVMALVPVWKRDPRNASDPDPEQLFHAVFVHEMTHTLQVAAVGRVLDRLSARDTLPADMTDDLIQNRFGERDGFRAAYEAERDLLFAAATATDNATARTLARRALDAARARRARFFTGPDSVYGAVEDIFLAMEGPAQWAAYRVMQRRADLSVGDQDVLARLRRGGRWWSQDEGLALFLVIDKLLPGWQSRVLSREPASVWALLDEATR